MKVLLVNDAASPIGGAELLTRSLRDGLRARGHEVRVFASDLHRDHPEQFADFTCSATIGRRQAIARTANYSAYRALAGALDGFRPDVVHVRMFLTQLSPLIQPLLRRQRAVFHVTDYAPICPRGTKQLPDGSPCGDPYGAACYRHGCVSAAAWPFNIAQLRLFNRWRDAFDAIVANSHATGEMLQAHGVEPVEVIWNGVPECPMRPPLDGPPVAAFAGRLTPEKGIDLLVRAMARVCESVGDAELWIAGEGPEAEPLRALVDSLGLAGRVRFLGKLPRADLESAFSRVWVQAVPSRWREPFGLVAAEGMMRGTAVVCSATGGLTEIVRDGETGLLVPPGDADALADALRRVLSDRARAESMGRAAHERAVAEFGDRVFLDRVEALHRRLLAGAARVPAALPRVNAQGVTP